MSVLLLLIRLMRWSSKRLMSSKFKWINSSKRRNPLKAIVSIHTSLRTYTSELPVHLSLNLINESEEIGSFFCTGFYNIVLEDSNKLSIQALLVGSDMLRREWAHEILSVHSCAYNRMGSVSVHKSVRYKAAWIGVNADPPWDMINWLHLLKYPVVIIFNVCVITVRWIPQSLTPKLPPSKPLSHILSCMPLSRSKPE